MVKTNSINRVSLATSYIKTASCSDINNKIRKNDVDQRLNLQLDFDADLTKKEFHTESSSSSSSS